MRPAFFDLEEFPDLIGLAQAWPEMRQDLDALHAPVMDIDRVNKPHSAVVDEVGQRVAAGEVFGWVKGWGKAGGDPDWTQYGLVLGDHPISYATAPRTLALLAGLRGVKVAAFVRLAPGTLLPAHTHPEVAAAMPTAEVIRLPVRFRVVPASPALDRLLEDGTLDIRQRATDFR